MFVREDRSSIGMMPSRTGGLNCYAKLAGMSLLSRASRLPRADLVAISSGGTTYALDVTVTHGQHNNTVQQALHAAEADKCRQYRVSQVGVLLPGEEKFLPLVHHHTGMLGGAVFDLANLILRDLATKSAVADGTPWQMAVGRTRERIYQELTTAHMKAQHRIFRACAHTL
eukprot:1667783-Amphidinium_carterae.1